MSQWGPSKVVNGARFAPEVMTQAFKPLRDDALIRSVVCLDPSDHGVQHDRSTQMAIEANLIGRPYRLWRDMPAELEMCVTSEDQDFGVEHESVVGPMTAAQAKAILMALICPESGVLSGSELDSVSAYLLVTTDEASLDGHFTADQLEAIACWMRDPAGVVGAHVPPPASPPKPSSSNPQD